MENFWELFFQVFDRIAILYAIMSGISLGSTFLLYLSLKYPPLTPLPVARHALLSVVVLFVLGTVFFAGQISQAIITEDPQWPRATGRYALWLVFSVAVAISLTVSRSFAKKRD